MGFGVSLTFIAVGAILAFATNFHISGLDLQMIGWIFILVGAVAMAVTFAYTRPRRRGTVTEVVDEEPLYITHPEQTEPRPHVHEPQPHVHDESGAPHPVAGWRPGSRRGPSGL